MMLVSRQPEKQSRLGTENVGHRQLASKQALKQSDSSHQLVSSVLKSGSTLLSAKPLIHVALIPIKSGSQLINLLVTPSLLPPWLA